MASCGYALQVSCASQKAPIPYRFHHPKANLSSDVEPRLRNLPQIPTLMSDNAQKTIKATSMRLLDAFVDNVFEFIDEPYHPLQANFAPVDEIEEAARVTTTHGGVPDDFPEGVYVRNGANPSQGGLKSAKSIFGKTSHLWVEGEGMIHALYFNKGINGKWTTFYNNKYVKTESFKMEKQSKKTLFLPATEGNPAAVLSAVILNSLRVGKVNKNLSNTNVFEHAGKHYSISEDNVPQEIDISTLETVGNWDNIIHSWNNRPFTSHPKKSPETGELIIHGSDAKKPFLELGVISADGAKLIHKVDLKIERGIICHEIGITKRYNVIMDFPLIVDPTRLLSGGSLIKYEKEKCARIGVMPRYGNADSVHWFGVEPCCTFHIINCYEEGDEVVVMACRAEDSIIPGPEHGLDRFEWFSRGFKHLNSVDQKNNENNNSREGFLFARPYMWRLNMKNGAVQENYLTGTDFAMDFPMINEKFTGLKNKYAYTQVVDSRASSAAGMVKYGGLAKLYLQERNAKFSEIKDEGKENIERLTRTEYHTFPENTFCSGTAFVPKIGAADEDDGWLITFVHNEKTNLSEVYIVDAKKFSSEPVARITIPFRVPYGFHGAFMPIPSSV